MSKEAAENSRNTIDRRPANGKATANTVASPVNVLTPTGGKKPVRVAREIKAPGGFTLNEDGPVVSQQSQTQFKAQPQTGVVSSMSGTGWPDRPPQPRVMKQPDSTKLSRELTNAVRRDSVKAEVRGLVKESGNQSNTVLKTPPELVRDTGASVSDTQIWTPIRNTGDTIPVPILHRPGKPSEIIKSTLGQSSAKEQPEPEQPAAEEYSAPAEPAAEPQPAPVQPEVHSAVQAQPAVQPQPAPVQMQPAQPQPAPVQPEVHSAVQPQHAQEQPRKLVKTVVTTTTTTTYESLPDDEYKEIASVVNGTGDAQPAPRQASLQLIPTTPQAAQPAQTAAQQATLHRPPQQEQQRPVKQPSTLRRPQQQSAQQQPVVQPQPAPVQQQNVQQQGQPRPVQQQQMQQGQPRPVQQQNVRQPGAQQAPVRRPQQSVQQQGMQQGQPRPVQQQQMQQGQQRPMQQQGMQQGQPRPVQQQRMQQGQPRPMQQQHMQQPVISAQAVQSAPAAVHPVSQHSAPAGQHPAGQQSASNKPMTQMDRQLHEIEKALGLAPNTMQLPDMPAQPQQNPAPVQRTQSPSGIHGSQPMQPQNRPPEPVAIMDEQTKKATEYLMLGIECLIFLIVLCVMITISQKIKKMDYSGDKAETEAVSDTEDGEGGDAGDEGTEAFDVEEAGADDELLGGDNDMSDAGDSSQDSGSADSGSADSGSVDVENDNFSLHCTNVTVKLDQDGNPAALIYFTFVNKTSTLLSMSEVFPPSVTQNGEPCATSASLEEYPEEFYNNDMKVSDGSSIDCCYVISLKDAVSPIRLTVHDDYETFSDVGTTEIALQ